jgi:hypothetical protein
MDDASPYRTISPVGQTAARGGPACPMGKRPLDAAEVPERADFALKTRDPRLD